MRSMPMPQAKPVNLFRVVADRLEDRWMHHPAAAQLDPPGSLAHRTTGAVALPAAEVDFRARLRSTERSSSGSGRDVRRKHLARERQQRPLQIGQRQPFADGQPFDLSEGRRVRQVQIVAPIDTAGHDDADRRLVRLHVADLHRRGMGAEQRARRVAVESRQRRRRDRACPACRARDVPPACSARRSSAIRPRPPDPRRRRSPFA